MIKRYGLILVAIAGFALSIFMIFYCLRKPPVAPYVSPPPIRPYEHYIAAEGIIESAFKNISIGVSFPDVITDVYTFVGHFVQKGQPLFKTDTRFFEAQLEKTQKDFESAQIDYLLKEKTFSFYERLEDKSAVSEQFYIDAQFALELAKIRLRSIEADVTIVKTNIEKSIIRAPINGQVLQVNIRVGESPVINSSINRQPLILFGDTQVYHVRVQIDEEDEWRFKQGAPAVAFVRGNSAISIPLSYVYIEPYITPKKSLSGSDLERIDTRVLEVVYKFQKENYPVFMGQLLDIYIEAEPRERVP